MLKGGRGLRNLALRFVVLGLTSFAARGAVVFTTYDNTLAMPMQEP